MLKNRLAVFIPSSKKMINVILELADIKKNNVFYDIGSGDGRILAEAAKTGIKVVGIEKNPLLNWIARRRVRKYKNVKIIQADVFKQDFSDATVIVAYLSQILAERLQKKIQKEVKNCRIILVDHHFLNWKPVKEKKVGLIPIRLYIK
jgi:16S rRNA A1518/A1519 N6-dimethyltransferase RsmA/KsgA/DIM1 with predicted DNA glycosylase/AP lyase activity